MNAYFNQYQNTQVSTASREQILLMLYDGAIRFVRQAEEAMLDKNFSKKTQMINKAMAIISEFSATLDFEVGGEIAHNLYALYDYMNRELIKGNISNDPGHLQIVHKLLTELRETWAEAVEIYRKEKMADKNVTASSQKSISEGRTLAVSL
ncbi:flagellar export chaperone FliS [Desulfuromonas sp. AOP6]|uniref:flagellar export chaperone FliS n=1 Tax=Desulfuromonas sp. AOP6 TaxID=1566351 RepID=UPI00126DFBDC|nr:flagellar export chaperone FliS [Desulfuromonas sp. AOP6]BCA79148.1 flagellar protein FliS [Desulfuromonas sp. AOP6]